MKKLSAFLNRGVLAFAFAFASIQIMAVPAGDNANLLRYDKPAVKWEQALPVGNGWLGGLIFGGTTNDRIQLNDITVWSGSPQPSTSRTDAWMHLGEIRYFRFQVSGFFGTDNSRCPGQRANVVGMKTHKTSPALASPNGNAVKLGPTGGMKCTADYRDQPFVYSS